MRVLVVGTGGREHALAWRIAFSRGVQTFITLGNGGTERVAKALPVDPTDIEGLVQAAKTNKIDFVVIGPEAPLAKGLVDRLIEAGILAFGPLKKAAMLEASKAFAHEIMEAAGVPCARFEVFDDFEKARRYVERLEGPLVIKADGLASGKGVTVAKNRLEAITALEASMVRGIFGDAGRVVVIEEFLEGTEASFMVLCDGNTILPLAPAKDHKRLLDNDQGPNTGGMGAISPVPGFDKELEKRVEEDIVRPVIEELGRRGIEYRGVLYAGLMLTKDGPKVLEFNCRFGDPEAQVVLVRFEGDFLEALLSCAEGRLSEVRFSFDRRPSVCVVLAAQNYPSQPKVGDEIEGLEEASRLEGVYIFHAGTRRDERGRLLTAGGRVLGVTAVSENLHQAREKAYYAASLIKWEGMHYRKDIGLL